MSRKRIRKSTYQRRYSRPLFRGKIYKTRDAKGGHYATIYKKNTKKNRYWIVLLQIQNGDIE